MFLSNMSGKITILKIEFKLTLCSQTWEACEALVAEGKVKPSDIVSHQFNMSDFESAFDTLMSGKACKIVVDPKH